MTSASTGPEPEDPFRKRGPSGPAAKARGSRGSELRALIPELQSAGFDVGFRA